MTLNRDSEIVILLANDAMEAAPDESPKASCLCIDAAATILVSRIRDAAGRRELAGLLSGYIIQQVEAVIASERAA